LQSDRYNLICGRTGSGKSTYLALLKVPRSESIILFDANDQHGGTALPRVIPDENIQENFERLVKKCVDSGKKVHLIVEEAQEVVGHRCSPYLKQWLRTGRNRGVTATFVTQIPADLHGSVLSNSTTVVVFKLVRPEDKGYLANWLGVSRADVEELNRFEYYEYTHERVKRGRIERLEQRDEGEIEGADYQIR
jgi:type IV secretory pathway VirB4 component